jgi:hypothetical protein
MQSNDLFTFFRFSVVNSIAIIRFLIDYRKLNRRILVARSSANSLREIFIKNLFQQYYPP